MKTNTAIMAMVIAMVVMIGMTGFAMAGSTTGLYNGDGSYNVNFGGAGTGDLTIITHTSFGNDFQHADWSNAEIGGYQDMDTTSSWTEIDRETTITGEQNGQMATGFTLTQTDDVDGNSLTTVAQYHDDVAGGSYVSLYQNTGVGSIPGFASGVGSPITTIEGHAYGADTYVGGSVMAVSDGDDNATVYANIGMTEGSMGLFADIGAGTMLGNDGAGLDIYGMDGAGDGTANIGGFTSEDGTAEFGFGVTNDGLGYIAGGNINGDPLSISLIDDFDTDYDATGYIYVID